MKKSFRLPAILLAVLMLLTATTQPARCEFDIKSNLNRVQRELEEIRGLKFRQDVPFDVKTREQIRGFLMEAFRRELPPPKLKALDATLKTFGFVGDDFKIWDFLISLYSEQVAGLYDYRSGKMLLMKEPVKLEGSAAAEMAMMKAMGIDLSMEELLLIHELNHALQDQHFDLKKLISRAQATKNDDYINAVQALIEGDATAIMIYSMLGRVSSLTGGSPEQLEMFIDMKDLRDKMTNSPMQGASMAQFQKAPLFFKRSLLFPYADGLLFVDTLKRRGGWELVNKAFRDLPKSTEQILHVEKYLSGDNPIKVTWKELPNSLGGYAMIEQNVAGELTMRILFENFIPGHDFKAAAAGWGGDSYRIYNRNDDSFLVWFTTWDRVQDAREFMAAYRLLLESKYENLHWTRQVPDRAYLGRAQRRHVYVAINGRDVLVMEKIPENITQELIQKAWLVNKNEW